MSNTPNINEIKSLLEWVNQSGDIQELNIKYGDIELAMSRTPGGLNTQAAAPAPAAPAPQAEAAPAPAPAATEDAPAEAPTKEAAPAPAIEKQDAPAASGNGTEVKSPMVGTFYAAPKPGADPFVKVGDTVEVGQVLCIVEVMKLMNNIEAKVAGTVTEIRVENEDAVEHGQVLMVIEEK